MSAPETPTPQQPAPKGGKGLVIAAIVVVAAAACGATAIFGKKATPEANTQPATVKAVILSAGEVPLTRTYVGRTAAKTSVDLKANVSGYLIERPFNEGGMIKKGDVLFRIDPRELQASLDSAKAKEAQAAAKLAQSDIDLKRTSQLATAKVSSPEDLDNARTNQASASADQRAAKAAVETAEVALSYATITAPFAGRIGKAAVSTGAMLTPLSGTLATLDQIDPISIEFAISEKELLYYTAKLADGSISSPEPGNMLVEVQMVDGSKGKQTGRIDFADTRVRPDTGTALLRAIMPNADAALMPGQFVRVNLLGLTRKKAILVPQSAVVQSPAGPSVYVVKADDTLESRAIKLGEWVEESWLVESGLEGGEKLVISGVQKVRPGVKVTVEMETPPSQTDKPQPDKASGKGGK